MSLSKSYFERYSTLFAEIKTSCERLSALQSTYDKKVSNIYHQIESQEFGIPDECFAYSSHNLYKGHCFVHIHITKCWDVSFKVNHKMS